MKKIILSITVKRPLDENPDTDCLGTYTDEYDPYHFDRLEGKMLKTLERYSNYYVPPPGREYRFFKPYAGGEPPVKNGHTNPLYVRYGKQDLARMEGLVRGAWCFVGVVAEAKVQLTQNGIVQRVCSGGVWGVESDAGEPTFKEIEEDELASLRAELVAMGFTADEIDELEVEYEN